MNFHHTAVKNKPLFFPKSLKNFGLNGSWFSWKHQYGQIVAMFESKHPHALSKLELLNIFE